ncbi:hypothetical protein FH972_022173 [Carpinus fangiana]|uniref:Uncharacterized protein n=1 Tax=Carpinus fangiana TaxID=176857 RepID=A0A5N6KS13_9ROSI|nr:hypothetical protein FH972_022173 [Carpinus fangiana]
MHSGLFTDHAPGDELLERAAADGSFDMYASHMFRDTCSVLTDNSAEWPRVLETVLARLEKPASQDDSLGGALLTPIPWLRANGGDGGDGGSNSSVSGRERSSSPLDADADGIATSSSPLSGASSPGHERASVSPSPIEPGEDNVTPGSGGITQGELPRQEQTASDPPAPVSSLPSRAHLAAASPEEAEALDVRRDIGDQGIPLQGDGVVNSAIEDRNRDEKHEQPHARGPDLIGMEDTGKQDPHSHGGGSGQVLDIEAAVGRASSKSGREHKETAESIEADPTAERSQKRKAEDGEGEGSDAQKMKQDNDGDVEIADASSAAATEKKSSDATGADTVDTIEQ